MGFYIFLIVVIAIIGLLMAIVILLQSGKGGGLAGIASGGATQMLGTRQAPDFLEKATWILGGVFVALCVITNFFIGRGEGAQESIIQQNATDGTIQLDTTPAPDNTQPAPIQAPAGEAIPVTPSNAPAEAPSDSPDQ